MLVVGLFAVLSWDSTFPDKRDVMVLAPLPIRSRTLFLAKITGVAAALGVTVVSLHSVAQIVCPGALSSQPAVTFAGQSIPASGGFLSFIRTFAAYWITMFVAGAFIFCCVLGVQGIDRAFIAAPSLPARVFSAAIGRVLSISVRILFTAGGCDSAVYRRGPGQRVGRVAIFVLVRRPISAIARVSGAAGVGASRLDRFRGGFLRDGSSLRVLILSDAAHDRRGAGYRAQRSRRALAAAIWGRAPNGHRPIQRAQSAAQPAASRHSRLLFGDRSRAQPAAFRRAGGAPPTWRRRIMEPRERAAARHNHYADAAVGGWHAHRVRFAARFEGELDLSHCAGPRRRPFYRGAAASHARGSAFCRCGLRPPRCCFPSGPGARPRRIWRFLVYWAQSSRKYACKAFRKSLLPVPICPGKTNIHLTLVVQRAGAGGLYRMVRGNGIEGDPAAPALRRLDRRAHWRATFRASAYQGADGFGRYRYPVRRRGIACNPRVGSMANEVVTARSIGAAIQLCNSLARSP